MYHAADYVPATHIFMGSKSLVYLQGGKRELVLGLDDQLLKLEKRSIPRGDVAELAVQALSTPQAENR